MTKGGVDVDPEVAARRRALARKYAEEDSEKFRQDRDFEAGLKLQEAGLGVVDTAALSIVRLLDRKWQIQPKDPILWTHKRLPNRHLWSKQIEVMESVRDNPRTAVKACHGVGKSYIAATTAAWWASAFPPDDTLIVSTAPTAAQVSAILWEEIRRAWKEGELPGKVGGDNVWRSEGGVLIGLGRKPADHATHAFQGLHKRRILVVIDEACGVAPQLWTAFEAVATGINCRQLAIGNPDDPGTEFAKVCKPGSGWEVIRISAFDSPNLTGEPVPDLLSEVLVSREWVEDKKERWGVDSPRYQSKVLGEFPEIGEDVLVPPLWIERAQNLDLLAEDFGESGKTGDLSERSLGVARVSVDVARFGSDETIIGVRRGGRFRVTKTLAMSATTETVGYVLAGVRGLDGGAHGIIVDGAGVGGGVVDGLREYMRETWGGEGGSSGESGRAPAVVDFQAGGKPRDPKKFLNLRAEWWWKLREMFQAGEIDIDPADDVLAAQLGSVKYFFNSKGQIQIESKADLKKRGMPSPDRADCLMMSLFGGTGIATTNVDVNALGAGVVPAGR